jgi:hypothetical protein
VAGSENPDASRQSQATFVWLIAPVRLRLLEVAEH